MAEPIPVQAPAGNSRKRVFILLGVAVGLLLFAVVVPKLLGGGGGGTETVTFGPSSGATTPTTAKPAAVAPIETFETFSNRDPFKPLINTSAAPGGAKAPPSAGPAPQPPAPPVTAPASVPTPVIVLPVVPSPSDAVSGGGVPSGSPVPASPRPAPTTTAPPAPAVPRSTIKVALLNVYTLDGHKAADVRVNSTIYEQARAGDVFASSFKVVSLSDRCGTFLYGDDRFTLCVGEEATK